MSIGTIIPFILGLLPAVLTAGLSGLLGTGMVNLFNSSSPRKWVVCGIQAALAVLALSLLLYLRPAQALPGKMPTAKQLTNLLSKNLLADLSQDVVQPLETMLKEYKIDHQAGTPPLALHDKLVELRDHLKASVQGLREDAYRWQRVYIGEPECRDFDIFLKLCDRVGEEVLDDRLNTLIHKDSLTEEDFQRLLKETRTLINGFLLN